MIVTSTHGTVQVVQRLCAVVKSRPDSFMSTICTHKYKILIEDFEGGNLLVDRGLGLGMKVVLKHVNVRLDYVLCIHLTLILLNTVAEIPFP
jgi:hypothetical protein